MGVMACDREGCVNVMCDRYSYTFGHLCGECFDELVNCDAEMAVFMETTKGTFLPSKDRDEYNEEFPMRD